MFVCVGVWGGGESCGPNVLHITRDLQLLLMLLGRPHCPLLVACENSANQQKRVVNVSLFRPPFMLCVCVCVLVGISTLPPR